MEINTIRGIGMMIMDEDAGIITKDVTEIMTIMEEAVAEGMAEVMIRGVK